MNLAGWCIRNNRTATVGFLLIALAGFHAFRTLPRLEDPEFTIRVAIVSTLFPGASPQKVEELITDKIEKKVQEMPEVKEITSESLTGQSVVSVEIESTYDDLLPIWTKLRNKIDDLRPYLPEGTIGPFVNDEFGDVFPIVIALTGDGYTYRELKDEADRARDALLALPDVAKVDFYGAQEERIFVEFSNARLAESGLAPHQLAELLKAQNVLQPGGTAVVGPESVTLEATGEFKSVEDIERVSLRVPGRAEAVYLRDVATIRRDFIDPPATFARFNGRPAIMLALSVASEGLVTEVGDRVRVRVDALEADAPVGLDYDLFLFQPRYVKRSIDDFTSNLGQAFVYVFVVMLLFCGMRMGLIAGALVPMAMLMTLGLMPLLGIKLQSVSIASLIIALGMLVDNGIVTSENMLVRLAGGEDRFEAATGAVRELWLPLLTSSLTTIFAFLPIAIAKSDVAEYCVSLFQVVTLTLLCSWVLSITLIPMLGYYFLKPKASKSSFEGGVYGRYRRVLIAALKHRGLVLIGTVALMISAGWAFKHVPNIFFPPSSREMLLIDFWQPYGTDIRTTRDRVARLEDFLRADTHVVSVGSFVGEGGPRWYLALNIEQQNPNYANIIVNLTDAEAVDALRERVRRHIEETFPDARASVMKLEQGPPVGAPIQIKLTGEAIDTLYALRDRIVGVMQATPGVINVRDDWGEWTKKLEIDINQEQAKRAGFTSYDVAASLQAQLSGLPATELREGRESIPIELRAESAYREDLGNIETLQVYSYQTGRGVPLLQLAKANLVWQPSDIRRRDKARSMTIKADLRDRFAADALAEIMPRIEALRAGADWPAGYAVEYAGENAESEEAQTSIMAGVPIALGLLALVLVFQFNSIRRPLIIALTIPPMVVGIAYGLWVSSAPFGFMAFLGAISLMGIIVNNAIMMIDRMELERAAGQTLQDAVVVAAQRRLRPIVMTATTTIIGLLPLSLSGGEMWRPMANTIMFGLAFATVLTLVLCPVLYSLFFRASFRDYRWDPVAMSRSKED